MRKRVEEFQDLLINIAPRQSKRVSTALSIVTLSPPPRPPRLRVNEVRPRNLLRLTANGMADPGETDSIDGFRRGSARHQERAPRMDRFRPREV